MIGRSSLVGFCNNLCGYGMGYGSDGGFRGKIGFVLKKNFKIIYLFSVCTRCGV